MRRFRRTGRPYWMDGRRRGRDHLPPFQGEPEAAPPHRPAGEAHARFPTGPLRQLQLSRSSPVELEADHSRMPRPQAPSASTISPSGRFPANGAWLAVQVLAHNLARWTARIGLDEGVVTTRTLRRRFFSLAGRLTRWPAASLCICHRAGLGKPSSLAPWLDCEPCHCMTAPTAPDPSTRLPKPPHRVTGPVRDCLPLHAVPPTPPQRRCPGPPSAPPTTTKGRHRPHLSESSADRRVPRPSPLVLTPRPLRIGGFGR